MDAERAQLDEMVGGIKSFMDRMSSLDGVETGPKYVIA